MHRRHVVLALLLFLAAAPSPVTADEPEPEPGAVDVPEPATADAPDRGAPPTLRGEMSLSLADAVAMGIENNLDVQIERFAPLISKQDTHVAWGAYDPVFAYDFGHASDDDPSANSLQTGDITDQNTPLDVVQITRRETSGNTALDGLIPWIGGAYRVGYRGERVTTDFVFQNLSPQYTAGVVGEITLPLMRGLFWSEPWTQVKLSGVRYQGSLEEFRRSLMDVVQQIERAYWNLVARDEDLRVAQKSLETAQALLELTQAQYEVGVVSRVEVVEAEAGLADREFNLIGAQNRYREAQDQLFDVVLGPYLSAESRVEIRASDRPERRDFEPDPERASELAFENRPELEIVNRLIEQNEIQLQFARNQRLPRLDFVGSYGFTGISGEVSDDSLNPNRPSFIPRDYGSAHDDFFSDKGAAQWSARAFLSIPLGNQQARGRFTQAEIELRRSRTRLRRLEQDIVLEVRSAVRNVKSAGEGIEAAERRRVAAAEQLRAEQIRLEHGESTPFDVLLRERDLVDAEVQRIFALQAYQDSLAALDRAQGTILRTHNVVIEEARTLR